VSPAVSLLIVGAGLHFASHLHLARTGRLDDERVPIATLLGGDAELSEREGHLRTRLSSAAPWGLMKPARRFLMVALCAALFIALVWASPRASIEMYPWDLLMTIGFGALALIPVASAWQLTTCWQEMDRLLQDVELREDFMKALEKLAPVLRGFLGMHPFARAPGKEAVFLAWQRELSAEAKEPAPGRTNAFVDSRSDGPSRSKMYQLVYSIVSLVVQLRDLSKRAAVSALILLLWNMTYPFQPARQLDIVCGFVLAGVALCTTFVFLAMERNSALSRVVGGEPGKIGWDLNLIEQLVLYFVVPVAGLAVAHFPQAGRYFLQWVGPLLQAVKLGGAS
jgi:hypothetical protein